MRAAKLCTAFLTMSALAAATPASAVDYYSSVLASGLNNPRGLAFAPDGTLYIAESGVYTPGGPSTTTPRGTFYYSNTGSITQVAGGVQTRILSGLPSLGSTADVSGPNDIAFAADGTGYVVIGLGQNPAVRTGDLAPNGFQLGQLYTFNGGGITPVADISAYEGAHNPAGGPVDSNPFHLAPISGGMLVTDAGANDLLRVDGAGNVSLVAAFAARDMGAGFPSDAVITGVAVAPDGSYYLSELTGAPFVPGAARIYHVLPDGTVAGYFGGFTMITDLAFGMDGSLYALELDTNGLARPGGTGALLKVNGDGSYDTLFTTGLVTPTGLAVGSDGAFYVTNFSAAAGIGQVLRIAAAPEPTSWTMLIVGFGIAGAALRRGRRRSTEALA